MRSVIVVGALRTTRERWVEEGLRVLAEGGVDAVRVEVLAKALGVTKGGFYGYFANRSALLAAMLDAWERQSVDEVLARIEREGGDDLQRVRLAGRLTFADDVRLVDLAVRDWARRDDAVAERLRAVDNRRMQLLRDALAPLVPDPAEVEARSLLAFCLAIGNHLVAADHPGRTRDEVVARAGDLILHGFPGHAAG